MKDAPMARPKPLKPGSPALSAKTSTPPLPKIADPYSASKALPIGGLKPPQPSTEKAYFPPMSELKYCMQIERAALMHIQFQWARLLLEAAKRIRVLSNLPPRSE